MVAKIASGKSIKGAVNYNENKAKEGKAELLLAHLYPKEAEELSFHERLQRLQHQADLDETIEHRCLHISLNFDPSEDLSTEKLQTIAEVYMQKIGFGEQPFLVYQHFDAAHPHLHIVSTSIMANGHSIRLHNNWKLSEKARKEIEQEFTLVPAESKSQKEVYVLKPADLQKAIYGKMQTKQAISNVVRSVVKHYKFSSIPEFNAILNQFSVMADRGEEGTKMYEKGGLVYSLIDQNMTKVGVPIKASSIYDRPILSELQKNFERNREKREPYKARVCALIEDILREGVDKNDFKNGLASHGINALFRQNEEGKIYGVTYIDNKTWCVFNGSDLGKAYSAKGILDRLHADNAVAEVRNNRHLAETTLKNTDFKKGIRNVLAQWTQKGMLVDARRGEDDTVRYSMGQTNSSRQNFFPFDYKMSAYFRANDYSPERSDFLRDRLTPGLPEKGADHFANLINECFGMEITSHYLSKELLEEAKKKKRRRR